MGKSLAAELAVLILCGVYAGGYYAGRASVIAPSDDLMFVGAQTISTSTGEGLRVVYQPPITSLKDFYPTPAMPATPTVTFSDEALIGFTRIMGSIHQVILCNKVSDLAAWRPRDIIIRECKETCKTNCKREE